MIKKISIIGAGYVGSSIAYSLMLVEAADEIALIDINDTADVSRKPGETRMDLIGRNAAFLRHKIREKRKSYIQI